MSVTEHRCITLHCDACGEAFGYDEGEVHFGVEDSATARNDAAYCDWGITDAGDFCAVCWAQKLCAEHGHVPAIDVAGEYCDRCEEKLHA